MAVLAVVPVEEPPAEVARVLEGAEAVRELRSILERLELRLRVRVVVGDVGPAVRLGDAEIREEKPDGLRGHGGTAIGVERELTRQDLLLRAGLGDELVCEERRLTGGNEPADDA